MVLDDNSGVFLAAKRSCEERRRAQGMFMNILQPFLGMRRVRKAWFFTERPNELSRRDRFGPDTRARCLHEENREEKQSKVPTKIISSRFTSCPGLQDSKRIENIRTGKPLQQNGVPDLLSQQWCSCHSTMIWCIPSHYQSPQSPAPFNNPCVLPFENCQKHHVKHIKS